MSVEVKVMSLCSVFNCETCVHHLKDRCPGCVEGNKVRVNDGVGPCGIYRCATSRGYSSCTECDGQSCPYPRSLEMACPVRGHFEKKRCYSKKLTTHFQEWETARSDYKKNSKISEKTVTRLRRYLFAIDDYIAQGINRVSSDDIARKVGVKDYLIRSDFSQFGEFGRPSIGYDTTALRTQLQGILHLNVMKNIIWIGALHLLTEPSIMLHFERNSFRIVGIYDKDPSKFPEGINSIQVLPLENAIQIISENKAGGAILAVQPEDAQLIADQLINAGIKGILNLSTAIISAPPTVCIRHLDILGELFALSYYCHSIHI